MSDKDYKQGGSATGQPGERLDHQAPTREDEIDLVDLWLFFWGRRKAFAVTVFLVAIIGIVVFEVLYTPKKHVAVRSVIEIQELMLGKTNETISFVDAFARRIEQVDLRRLASTEPFKQIKSQLMTTKVNPVEGTGLIELVTIAEANLEAAISDFHEQLGHYITAQSANSSRELNVDLHLRVVELEAGISDAQSTMKDLETVLRQYSVSSDTSDQQGQMEVNLKMAELNSYILQIRKDLRGLDSMLRAINPRILVVASVSEPGVGISKKRAYALIIIFALFAGVTVLLVHSFASRVRERVAAGS